VKYIALFVPFVFAYLLQDTPAASYAVSWLGSLFILWVTLTGRIKPLPEGRPLTLQLFRPVVFTQIVFAAYTALSSIFFFVALMRGKVSGVTIGGPAHLLSLTAEAQSYYVLAHASIATGLLLFMDYSKQPRFQLVGRHGAARFLLAISALFFCLSLVTRSFSGTAEVSTRLGQIAIVASVFSFALSLINREFTHIWVNAFLFAANFVSALLSGWKEQVLIILLLFFAAIFPAFKRVTAVMAVVTIALFVTIMPAYTNMYRNLAWYGNVDDKEAMSMTIAQMRSGELDTQKSTEEFLTQRISEISLFVRYLDRVPEKRPFYGSQILLQSAANLIPRQLWPGKPSTEQVVMERVYENGLYSRVSRISAKPQYVVDAYLTAGIPGIVIGCFIFGMLAAIISRVAERWFGGYTMGSGLIYGALFQIFWRGNSFEFFAGTLMWSVIVMVLLFQAGRYFGLLVPSASNPHVIPGKSGVALAQPAVAIRRNASRLGSGRIPSQ
jgi:hypothetical protein